MTEDNFRILALCGSLRRGSYNQASLEVAQQLAPKGVEVVQAMIGGLPFFNQDLEADPPKSVVELRKQIARADAVLFVTPEYNYSVPAVLKNAIEWGSRPYGKAVLNQKPAAIMGASSGMLGTSRAQYHLRQMLIQVDMYVLNRPEVMIPFAGEKIDENGKLVDEETREKIGKLVEVLVEWSRKLVRV